MKPYCAVLFPILFSALILQAQEAESGTVEVRSPSVAKPILEEKREKQQGKTRVVPVIYHTILSKSSGNSITISMGEKKEGGGAIEWTSRLGHEQQWQLKSVEGEWFQLIARHSDKALMIRDPSGGHLIQGNSANEERSHWKLISDSDGFVRIVNRESGECIGVSANKGSHGKGVVLSKKADTDRQKWRLQVAEIDYVKEPVSKKLAIPASTLIGRKHPKTTEELREFLHGTTWSIRYESPEGSEEYRMTFDRKGTLELNTGRVSTLHCIGPQAIKLWNYDYAALSVHYNYFQAVDANGKVYYGVLLPHLRTEVPTPELVARSLVAKGAVEVSAADVVAFDAPSGDGRRGAKGILLKRLPTRPSQGSEWSFDYVRGGSAQVLQILHPVGRGQAIVHISREDVGISAPAAWCEIGYGRGSHEGVERHRDFDEVFPLEDNRSYQIASRMDPHGDGRVWIDKLLVATFHVSDTKPISLKIPKGLRFPGSSSWDELRFKGKGLPMTWKPGWAGIIVGPRDGGIHECREVHYTRILPKEVSR